MSYVPMVKWQAEYIAAVNFDPTAEENAPLIKKMKPGTLLLQVGEPSATTPCVQECAAGAFLLGCFDCDDTNAAIAGAVVDLAELAPAPAPPPAQQDARDGGVEVAVSIPASKKSGSK